MVHGSSRTYSLDTWVMLRPARAFAYAASLPADARLWTAVRRPLFLTGVLACVVSLAASGTLTLRLAAPAASYWAFIPLTELFALVVLAWPRRRQVPLASAIDTFFAGHGPWTLFLIAVASTVGFLSPDVAWTLLTGPWLLAMVGVIAWSAYIDLHYFQRVLGANRPTAWRNVILFRLVTWAVVFTVFAVPVLTPWAIIGELVAAVKEVTGL